MYGTQVPVVLEISEFDVSIVSYGQATPSTFTFSESFSSGGQPICGGEPIEFSGNMLFVLHSTPGPNGKFDYSLYHINFHGVTGVGTISGDRYVLTETDNLLGNLRQISANEFMTQIHGTLVSQGGKAINIVVEILFHTTVNANGQVTANVEREDVKCMG
jgi:hypothetical protein